MSIWYNKKELVSKELEALLPQASPKWRIQYSNMWVRQFFYWVIRKRNQYGYRAPWPKFYFWSRGANFKTIYFGPFNITYKQPWLLMSAQALHPIIVREHNDTVS